MKNILVLVALVAFLAVVDAAYWTHRFGKFPKNDAYFFPNACAAVDAANLGNCPANHGLVALHQNVFIDYTGCPHSHWGKHGNWVRYHDVRFSETLKKGGVKIREHGLVNHLVLKNLVCKAHFVKDAPTADVEVNEANVKDQDPAKKKTGKEIVGIKIGKDAFNEKDGGSWTFPIGVCTEAEIKELVGLGVDGFSVEVKDGKATIKPNKENLKKLKHPALENKDTPNSAPSATPPPPKF